MIIRGKEKWKEVIEAQKQSGLTIKKYCNDNQGLSRKVCK